MNGWTRVLGSQIQNCF